MVKVKKQTFAFCLDQLSVGSVGVFSLVVRVGSTDSVTCKSPSKKLEPPNPLDGHYFYIITNYVELHYPQYKY